MSSGVTYGVKIEEIGDWIRLEYPSGDFQKDTLPFVSFLEIQRILEKMTLK